MENTYIVDMLSAYMQLNYLLIQTSHKLTIEMVSTTCNRDSLQSPPKTSVKKLYPQCTRFYLTNRT